MLQLDDSANRRQNLSIMALPPRLLYKLNLFYWKIFKPTTVGVRILLIKEGKIILVKHTYQDCWYIPGGGVKKRETGRSFLENGKNETAA